MEEIGKKRKNVFMAWLLIVIVICSLFMGFILRDVGVAIVTFGYLFFYYIVFRLSNILNYYTCKMVSFK